MLRLRVHDSGIRNHLELIMVLEIHELYNSNISMSMFICSVPNHVYVENSFDLNSIYLHVTLTYNSVFYTREVYFTILKTLIENNNNLLL